MKWKILGTISFVVMLMQACHSEKKTPSLPIENEVQFLLQPTFGMQPLALDQTYISDEGYAIQFTDIKCYFTSLFFGSNLFTTAALFDYRQKGSFVIKAKGSAKDDDSLAFFLGVDSSYNHLDPSTFSNSNPLNIAIANDMHWDWNPGYIFVKIEAKIDTIIDGVEAFNHYAVFHVGGDNYLRKMSFNNLNWQALSPNLKQFKLKFDAQKFLNNGTHAIDLKEEYSTHSSAGQEVLTLKVMEQFKSAINVY
jgi:hypothetical protein